MMKTRAVVDSNAVKSISSDAMLPGSALRSGLARWEYFTLHASRTENLRKFGEEGWELTAVIPAAADKAVFYFRRPIV